LPEAGGGEPELSREENRKEQEKRKMNIAVMSLIALLAAIVIGFLKDQNVGILCMAFAMILGKIYGLSNKDLLSGFSSSLLIQMAGVTFLFGIVRENGTLMLTARKLTRLTGRHVRLIPIVMYLIGAVLSGVGPGAIPCLAIIPMIAIPVALTAGLNPLMLAVIGDLGVMAARMSPLTPEAAVVRKLMEEQGIMCGTVPIMKAMVLTTAILAVIIYIYFKGWKLAAPEGNAEETLQALSPLNWLTIAAMIVLAVGVMFFGLNVGLLGFALGSVLLFFSGSTKKAIADIPWNVIWMVLGVGLLMHVIQLSGGVDIMVSALQNIVTADTVSTIMGILGCVMSLFSSGLGVVFPTLIPLAGGLASSVGGNAVSICSAIVIGGTIAGYTPMSTTGALIMAGIGAQENAEERFPQNKIFMQLLAISLIALLVEVVLSAVGLYDLFLGV
jgi:di/tricarboxylate transporter